jgi:hypothetical protein
MIAILVIVAGLFLFFVTSHKGPSTTPSPEGGINISKPK